MSVQTPGKRFLWRTDTSKSRSKVLMGVEGEDGRWEVSH